MTPEPALFEQHQIRRVYDEATETWWFSVVDILQVLIQQPDYQAARNYWKVLKHRLAKEGSQVVTNCNQLKLTASDGKHTSPTWPPPKRSFASSSPFPAQRPSPSSSGHLWISRSVR